MAKNEDGAIKLFNKGERKIQFGKGEKDFIAPGQAGSFTPAAAEKLKGLYKGELLDMDDVGKVFEGAEGAGDATKSERQVELEGASLEELQKLCAEYEIKPGKKKEAALIALILDHEADLEEEEA